MCKSSVEAYWATEGSSSLLSTTCDGGGPTFARRGELGLNTSNQPKCKVEEALSSVNEWTSRHIRAQATPPYARTTRAALSARAMFATRVAYAHAMLHQAGRFVHWWAPASHFRIRPIIPIPRDQTILLVHEPGASDPNPVARASRLAGHSALHAPAVWAHAELVSHRGLQTAPRATACECSTCRGLGRTRNSCIGDWRSKPGKCTVHLLVTPPTGTESSGSTSRNGVRVLCPERTIPWW